jgi:hypothetical protein
MPVRVKYGLAEWRCRIKNEEPQMDTDRESIGHRA